jgi:uncharacterized membrane protein YgcG
MTTFHRLRFLFVALAMCLVAAVVPAQRAYAGTLHIRDEAHVLSADAAARLRSVVTAAPFDARFVVTSDYPDAQDLSRHVGSLVTEPNDVVVGLDPQHHHVQVHFGTGSRVPRSEWAAIERAGNDAFRRGDWEGGAAAIFRAASQAVASPAGDAMRPEGAAARPSLIGPGMLLLVVAGAIGIAVYFARKRSAHGPPPAYGPPGDPRYGGPPFAGPGYPPQGGGLGPLGGGLIGAGLGGLAGYELGKMEGEREGRHLEQAPDRGSTAADPDGNFDEGGGGSSWDNDGGDFGGDGGGGDGGGGGSDF